MFKKMTDGGIWARHHYRPHHGDTPHMRFIQETNDSALQHTNSARHGQNQEREKTPTIDFYIFPPKILFDGKFKKSLNNRHYVKKSFEKSKCWIDVNSETANAQGIKSM